MGYTAKCTHGKVHKVKYKYLKAIIATTCFCDITEKLATPNKDKDK